MSELVRFVGSAVIALILVSIPGLYVASVAFKWDGFLKILFCVAMVAEYVAVYLLCERSENVSKPD